MSRRAVKRQETKIDEFVICNGCGKELGNRARGDEPHITCSGYELIGSTPKSAWKRPEITISLHDGSVFDEEERIDACSAGCFVLAFIEQFMRKYRKLMGKLQGDIPSLKDIVNNKGGK